MILYHGSPNRIVDPSFGLVDDRRFAKERGLSDAAALLLGLALSSGCGLPCFFVFEASAVNG